MTRRTILLTTAAGGTLFTMLQLVPCRVDNPPVVAEPVWDSPTTQTLAERACYDCHSNETSVPWYGSVAPASWLVREHVDEGRSALNFSDIHRVGQQAHEAGEEVHEGEMPPQYYLALHPSARLTVAERGALARGLDATLGGDRRDDHHD